MAVSLCCDTVYLDRQTATLWRDQLALVLKIYVEYHLDDGHMHFLQNVCIRRHGERCEFLTYKFSGM